MKFVIIETISVHERCAVYHVALEDSQSRVLSRALCSVEECHAFIDGLWAAQGLDLDRVEMQSAIRKVRAA
jgi:hypothetical protein